MNGYRHILGSLLIESAGGLGNDIHTGLRQGIQQKFGSIPACVRSLAIDWASDPPVGFAPSETGRIALPSDCAAIAARIDDEEADVAWLAQLIRADVLSRYGGHEAVQVPAFCRAGLAWTAHNGLGDGRPSWLDLLRTQLTALAPGGAAMYDTVANAGVPAAALQHGSITAVFIVGAEGGTGTGALIPLAIATRWLAVSLGLKLECHAWIVSGHYRPRDGDEETKAVLAHALDIDLEYVMTPGPNLRFPLGPELRAAARPRLFESVFREEVSGRLLHDYESVVAQCAGDLLFTYTTTAAADLMRSQVNKTTTPRLRGLAQRPAWPSPMKRKEAYGD